MAPPIAASRTPARGEQAMADSKPSSSTSDDDQQQDERKQKRMLSNRESARRSRQRKQQHLEDLRRQLQELRAENSEIVSKLDIATHQFSQLHHKNEVLRAHAVDLSHQLRHLNLSLSAISPSSLSVSVSAALPPSDLISIDDDDE